MKTSQRNVVSLLIAIASLVLIVAGIKAISGLLSPIFAFFIYRASDQPDYVMAQKARCSWLVSLYNCAADRS